MNKKERIKEINKELKWLRQARKEDLRDIRRLMNEKRTLTISNK